MNIQSAFTLLLCTTLLSSACDTSSPATGELDASPDQQDGSSDVDMKVAQLTWSQDIAPLISKHCGACHVSGGAAPFALDSFESLQTYGEISLSSMERGSMPPWSASENCNPIMNERLMPADDIQTFKAWWQGSRAEGPPLDPSNERPETTSSFEPTHQLKVPAPYTPVLGESDDYRCFLLDMDFEEAMYLKASNVKPGNNLVHHVLVYALTEEQAEEARILEESQEGPGYTCFGGPIPLGQEEGGTPNLLDALSNLSFPDQIGSWVPGSTPFQYEQNAGVRIDQGSRLVMQIHYSAVAGEALADDATEYQAVFTTEAPDFLVRSRPVAQRNLSILAGTPETVASISLPYYGEPSESLIGMVGHMHLLGTSLQAKIERADGSAQCGLDINKWDFDWQEAYLFESAHRLTLQEGDTFTLTCTYDNSMANQPVINGMQQQPRDVQWGEGTLDEMCLLYVRAQEPYSPPATHSTACSGDCLVECGGSLECLARCEADDVKCAGCIMEQSLSCDTGRSCLGDVLTVRGCLESCLSSAIMIGGNFGACMEGECADSWSDAATCMSNALMDEACTQERQECGL